MKKTLSLFLAFTLLLSLTACQQTPNEALVAQKDKDRLESIAAETASHENTLKTLKETTPKTYNFHYDASENTLIQAVDAPIQLPDSDTIPTYRVSAGTFSQELVTNVYNSLFQGEKTFAYVGESLTKSDIMNIIIKLKQDLAEIKASDDMDENSKQSALENTQQLISNYEKNYETAPEESTLKKIEVDSTLQKNNTKESDPESSLYCSTDSDSNLAVYNYSSSVSSMSYLSGSATRYASGMDGIPVTEEEANSEITDSIGISFKDAKEIADNLLRDADIDTQLVQIYLQTGFTEEGDTTNPFYDTSSIDFEENYSAFRFYYTRVINGIDAVFTAEIRPMENEEEIEEEIRKEQETKIVSVPWGLETIDIIVSKNGIEKLRWDAPISVDEVLSDNAGPLSFQDAAGIFEKMAPTIYYGNETTFTTIDITSIKLSYMRVRDSGTELTGLLVPVWAFYGNWYQKNPSESGKGNLATNPPYLLLAINAMDGTVIDTQTGY